MCDDYCDVHVWHEHSLYCMYLYETLELGARNIYMYKITLSRRANAVFWLDNLICGII